MNIFPCAIQVLVTVVQVHLEFFCMLYKHLVFLVKKNLVKANKHGQHNLFILKVERPWTRKIANY